MFTTGLKEIPKPVYPDPNTLPVPEPCYHQLVKMVNRDKKRNKEVSVNTVKYFSILTPKNLYKSDEVIEQKKEEEEKKDDEI